MENVEREDADFLYGGPIVFEFINIAVFTPLMEEIVFRGLIFTRLRRGMREFSAARCGWRWTR